MVHKSRTKPEHFEIPLAYQVWGKYIDGNWYPISQQRKYEEDSEKDELIVKKNPTLKPFFREFKVVRTPASASELAQRDLLKKLEGKPKLRGVVESFTGTVAESKWGGSLPIKMI